MNTITYTSLRANLAKTIDSIVNDHVPILVRRQKGGDAVLISKEDYRSFEERAYLMQSMRNASCLEETAFFNAAILYFLLLFTRFKRDI